jgi:ATP-dependent exoDNAse (exonuclease V) alpha subunit
MKTKIEVNDEFKEAIDLISKSNYCVFISGNAGTGKTTFLRYYMTQAKKKTIILAPTGVAALNAGGETIHSFFKFKTDITVSKIKKKKLNDKSIYKKVETIIIDEASMLRCDLLDCIDKFLRINRERNKEPFGGVQLVFIGDLRQLPPVVKQEEKEIFASIYSTPFFLSARVLNECMLRNIELKKIYRQKDEEFINLLNCVRNKNIDEKVIKKLNEKVVKNLQTKDMTVYLTTTNKRASYVNNQHLQNIKSSPYEFDAETENINSADKSNAFPAETKLVIKRDAQVMMLNNDSKGRWVNGSIGVVEDVKKGFDSDKVLIYVRFRDGSVESVEPYKWELFKYKWNDAAKQIETESAGSFRQYPLKLSWAVTIHKSQGKTFDNVIIDMENGAFAPGQLYVALSRCSNFDGISLLKPVTKRDFL